jgi:hypothetical protein
MSIFDTAVSSLPSLPLQSWEPTKDTLHLWVQIIGKIRLKLMPPKNHWWFATLYVNSRGLGTSPIPYQNRFFEINFDFIDHQLEILDNKGHRRSFHLHEGLSVSEFYQKVFDSLSELGIQVSILARPYDHKSRIPFELDKVHASYDTVYVQRFWSILLMADRVFKKFSGRFNGKCSPVQLFWHSFDLAVTRFSGKKGPSMEGANRANAEAYSHECLSAGFWAGDENTPEPAFYSYTYPSPAGIENEPLLPTEAKWIELRGSPMALYSYEDLCRNDDPEHALLDFLESSYMAGAKLAGWKVEELRSTAS